jgi:MFS family permease
MTDTATTETVEGEGNPRLSLLLATAMFVLVVDTSLMNVSISAVVKDLDTTVSGVQSAIALEALVSAAFILISSKIGDLIGRKRAYVLGLMAYAIGALAMTLAQSLATIIVFWAIIGGLGASLLLPAMQSLIHGNFEGTAQKKTYALVGAAAAIAAAVGPLLGGFLTTYISWRVGFLLEVIVIAVVLSQIRLVKDVPYTGDRHVDYVGAGLSVLGMGGVVLGILVWQEGGDYVALLIALGVLTLEHDAQVVSNTQLEQLLRHERPTVQKEVLSINTHATNLALQVALLIPILAGLLGLFDASRMMRLPDIAPSASVEAAALA